jgi:hypothetical protein
MRAAFGLAMVLLLPAALGAEMLRFDFTGVVSGTPSGIFAGSTSGDPVSGYYRYDSALSVSPGANPSESSSWFGFANPGMLWEFEITVGGVTRRTAGAFGGGGSPWPFLALTDDPATDAFSLIIGQVGSENDDQAILSLSDATPVPPDGVAPGSGNLTAAAPTTAPDPALFDDSNCSYIAREASGVEIGEVGFLITTLGAAVPVPSLGVRGIAALACLIGAAAAWRLRHRKPSQPEP